ncbi:cytochrome c biogenesis protein CcsA [Helicobacter burdigaliensis]|uniref:cytochrome c biogenesis protein CcsA n=1 Tax=Helicobacter burdigaliensis TaxID=2315334 RepID=UPI000EF69552|nr:cytochrome c biogenesis protein CcsA [Helicobacter burdigaliensis]
MKSVKNFLNFVIKGFCNFWVTFVLLFIYGSACAVATFVENDYGTPSAKALIYNTQWFDLLHLLLVLNLIGVLLLSRAWQRKKYASVLFHSSLVVIFIGAAITRYYGFEGVMHIREGEKSNTIKTQEEFLSIFIKTDKVYRAYFPVNLTPLVQQHFDKTFELPQNKQTLSIKFLEYTPAEDKMSLERLKVEIAYQNNQEIIEIEKNTMGQGPTLLMVGDLKLGLEWGSIDKVLPFYLELKDFQLDRYAGSMSPSSYASEIILEDTTNNIKQPYRIFMNNVLDYGGFRFFQSSYDQDELGTVLSVNKDPGKIPTYIGYAMLTLGLLWSFFVKNGRFYKLGRYLKNQNLALLFACSLALFNAPLYANENNTTNPHQEITITKENIQDLLDHLKKNSSTHANKFGKILVQDFGGRIKPLDTLAMEYVHKITQTDNFQGLSNMQILLGMMTYPAEFKRINMISTKTPKLRELIGVSKDQKRIAFDDLFTKEGEYKLTNFVEEANRKKPAMRSTFDKDVIAVDERINAAFLIYTAQALRIIPDFKQESNTWYAPSDAMANFDTKDSTHLQKLFGAYFASFHQGLVENKWENADLALKSFKTIQEKFGADLLPSKSKLELEIFLNHYNIFDNLTYFYIIAGLILFFVVIIQIFRNQSVFIPLTTILYIFIVLLALTHTIGLGVRWYVGGHAPWSNAYESMIYIAWAAGIAGVLFFRRSYLALSTSSFLAGISLFVAHLGFMDPQIGNLVPVLKSYWLNIHVSIITASYGFLGLCFLLGAITLALFILRNKNYPQIDSTILTLHVINEMAMILGLSMLTVGNFLGGVWANESWGRYWGWDPKETWALISIVVYIIVLHARFIPKGNSPYVFATLSVVAFYSILMTYFGVNFYLSGLHSYAAGDPLPIPSFLYYFVATTILLIILASRKSDLQPPKLS